jgi:hypothetical protein
MAITVTCQCGKKLGVKDELAGKRVKCPACGTILTVPAAEAPAPMDAEVVAESETPGEEGPAPRKKGAKADGRKKSNKMLWIGAGVGVLVLGFCCLSIAGIGGWWFFLRGGPEKTIIGKWGLDLDAMKKNEPMFKELPDEIQKSLSSATIEIKSDGGMTMTAMGKTENGKWKSAGTKGNVVTLETKQDGANKEWEKTEVTVLDSNHLKLVEKGSKDTGGKDKTTYLKRL